MNIFFISFKVDSEIPEIKSKMILCRRESEIQKLQVLLSSFTIYYVLLNIKLNCFIL